MTGDNDYPSGAEILSRLQDAVGVAEDMALPPTDRRVARRVSDELIPALFDARTYVEVGHLKAPEIRLGLRRASLVASDLADSDPRFASLHNRLRSLQEEAGLAARAVD